MFCRSVLHHSIRHSSLSPGNALDKHHGTVLVEHPEFTALAVLLKQIFRHMGGDTRRTAGFHLGVIVDIEVNNSPAEDFLCYLKDQSVFGLGIFSEIVIVPSGRLA